MFAVMENEKRQREAAQEREELLTKIEQNKRIEEENQARVRAQADRHQNDLIGQMHYNRRMRESERVCVLLLLCLFNVRKWSDLCGIFKIKYNHIIYKKS